jgi:hypothetical protein
MTEAFFMAEDCYYLTLSRDKLTRKGKTGYLAVITKGSKILGDKEIIVCSVTLVKNKKQARLWYQKEMETREWEKETQVFQRIPGMYSTEKVDQDVADLTLEFLKKSNTIH